MLHITLFFYKFMDTEESLIQRIQRGEYDMFEKIYTTYFDKIYAFIFIKSNGDKTLTEDICSETFMKAFEKLPEFHTEASNFRSWLYTIAYHTFIDFIVCLIIFMGVFFYIL